MLQGSAQGWLMGLASYAEREGEDELLREYTMRVQRNYGIANGLQYTLLAAHELASGERLLKVRNPWADVEWKGKWSDHDAESWTEELKQELWRGRDMGGRQQDGIFFITYDKAEQFFETLTVMCYGTTTQDHTGSAMTAMTDEELLGVFQAYDSDCSGYLDWPELLDFIKALCSTVHMCARRRGIDSDMCLIAGSEGQRPGGCEKGAAEMGL